MPQRVIEYPHSLKGAIGMHGSDQPSETRYVPVIGRDEAEPDQPTVPVHYRVIGRDEAEGTEPEN